MKISSRYRNGAWSLPENSVMCQCKVCGFFNNLVTFKDSFFFFFSVGLRSLSFCLENLCLSPKNLSTFLMNI